MVYVLLFDFLIFSFSFNEVSHGKDGMGKHDTRPAVSHHSSDLFPHIRFVAVDRTIRAKGLVTPMRTLFSPQFYIVQKLPALFAKRMFAGFMVPFAILLDHKSDNFEFSFLIHLFLFAMANRPPIKIG